jgi:hypothetical protein
MAGRIKFPVGQPAELGSNSPLEAPLTNALHSARLNMRTGPFVALESRRATQPPRNATSTQLLLAQ